MNHAETVTCQTPSPGKAATRIVRWKYDLVRGAILRILHRSPEGVRFKELAQRVEHELSSDDRERLGSLSWYTTVVKLDMECRGELMRETDRNGQLLRETTE